MAPTTTPLKIGDLVKQTKPDGGRKFYGPARIVDVKSDLYKCEERSTKNFFWINRDCLQVVEQ
jgi:hypothetical protein